MRSLLQQLTETLTQLSKFTCCTKKKCSLLLSQQKLRSCWSSCSCSSGALKLWSSLRVYRAHVFKPVTMSQRRTAPCQEALTLCSIRFLRRQSLPSCSSSLTEHGWINLPASMLALSLGAGSKRPPSEQEQPDHRAETHRLTRTSNWKIELILWLIYVPFRRTHSDELRRETGADVRRARRPPALRGVAEVSLWLLGSSPCCPAICQLLFHTWQRGNITEGAPSTEEAVMTVPPFCWSATAGS